MAKKKRSAGKDSNEFADGAADFEELLSKVETVVERLESGDLGLVDSLSKYEEGIKMVKQCHQILESAEERISVLMSVEEDGTAHVMPVDAEEDTENRQIAKDREKGGRTARRAEKPTSKPEENMDDLDGLF